MARFSVIIPARNANDTLTRAVLSARDFMKHGDEVIVVDDASDSPLELTDGLVSSVLQRLESLGPGVARNDALHKARGEWVLFLDADDAFTGDAREMLLEHIETFGSSDLDLVFFDFYDEQFSSQLVRRNDHYLLCGQTNLLPVHYVRHKMNGAAIFAAYRREFVLNSGLFFHPGIHEDIDFNFNSLVAAGNRVSYLPAKLYWKSRTQGSITATYSKAHAEAYMNAWSRVVSAAKRLDSEVAQEGNLAAGVVAATASRLRLALNLDRGMAGEHMRYLYELASSLDFTRYIGVRAKENLASDILVRKWRQWIIEGSRIS